MSLLRVRRREARTDYPTSNLSELYRRREAFSFDSGVPVDGATAARHAAVWACKDLVGRLISTLPLDEYRREAGVFTALPPPPVLLSPDGELDVSDFNYQVLDALLTHGNAFALIERYDRDGWPAQVRTLPQASVSYQRKGRIGPIDWKIEGKKVTKYPEGDLWHIPAYVIAGCPVGLSPISYAALTVGHGLAAQAFAARYFRDGAIPTAVLKNEAEVPGPLAELVQQRWIDNLAGNRKPQVLGDGWAVEWPSVSAQESQFLEAIRANAGDVCKFFGVDPSDIGVMVPGASRSYQSVEAQQIQLLVRTLGPWIVRLERAWSRLRPRPKFVRFNTEEFTRLDTATLIKKIESLIRNGVLSVNEARQLLDRPGIGEDGDRYLWPPLRQQLSEVELAGLVDDADELINDVMPEPEPVPVAVPAPATNGNSGGA
jgi:HK97 family phage portal protein